MWWKKRFLELMVQQTTAIERLCMMQHAVIQHMQHLLMLQDVQPQKLIVPDSFTHPLFDAFEEIDVASIQSSTGGDAAGHVYVMVAENGWSKIGMSRNIQQRIKQLKIQFPFRTKLVHAISTDDVVWAEQMLHSVFEDCRLLPQVPLQRKGRTGQIFEISYNPISALGTEWFRLSAQAVMWIRTIHEMNLPERDENENIQWNEPVISRPKLKDWGAYWEAHIGSSNGGKRRRIELLEEYDVDKFWSQFVEPTQKAPKVPKDPPQDPRAVLGAILKKRLDEGNTHDK